MADDDPVEPAPVPPDAPASSVGAGTEPGSGLVERLSGSAVDPRDRMPRWVPRAIALFLGGVVLLVLAEGLYTELRDLLITIVIAMFVSFALEPAVNRLAARGWRRGTATGLVFVLFVVFSLLFLAALAKLVADEVSNLVESSPEYVQNVEDWLNATFDLQLSGDDLRGQLTDADGPVRTFATQAAGNALGISASVIGVVFRFFTIALFVFYLVADGPRFRRVICSFLRPDRQRQVLETWEIAMAKTGGYIYSRGLLAILSGFSHWIAFEIIGVPYAVALAVFVGLVSQFVPVIGTYLAAGLPAFIALASDPLDAVWVVGFAVVYQQVENYLLAPRVTARTMNLHPAVAFGSVLAGIGLLGGIGALLALPASAIIQALGSTYIERHPVVESEMTANPERVARAGWVTRARVAWRGRRSGNGP